MDKRIVEAFRFFHEQAGGIVGQRAVGAIALARAEVRAKEMGMTVWFEDEDHPWDGDCEAPPIHVWAACYRGSADAWNSHKGTSRPLASLGGIGLLTWNDPYVRVIKAELFMEALEEIDAEHEREAFAIHALNNTQAVVPPGWVS